MQGNAAAMREKAVENQEIPKAIGRYEVLEAIGKGSMGTIYKGIDHYIKRTVAIKVTLPDPTVSEDEIRKYRERFFTEAQAAGSLLHPNIVAIYDAGLEGDTCYIAMEFVDGSPLTAFCTRQRLLPFEKVMYLSARICEALDFAHQQGIIHRDIKPANIMVTREGTVKVADFGVAKLLHADAVEGAGIIGSPGYMAPEMLQDGRATKRSDLFSLGVTIYELLTGEQPFRGETLVERVRKTMQEDPLPVHAVNAQIPEQVSRVIMKALAKDPLNRYQGTMEFLFQLKSACKETKAQADGEPADERIKYLKALRFFKDFRESELAEVLRVGTWFHYKEGSMIVQAEEKEKFFFIVVLGQVRVERHDEIIAVIDRGSCFGEMAALTGQRRTASILASQDCVAIKIDASIMDNLSKDLQLRFYKQFLHTLIGRLDSTSEKLHR
jgi:eukaryotic-like serine/threonine-protein kinase